MDTRQGLVVTLAERLLFAEKINLRDIRRLLINEEAANI